MPSLFDHLTDLEGALQEHQPEAAQLALTRIRSEARRAERRQQSLEADIARYQRMMARTVEVTLTRGLEPVTQQLLDGMIAIVSARRAFLGLFEQDTWRFLAARDHTGADIADPAAATSSTIIQQMRTQETPSVAHNAAAQETWAGQTSVHALRLRSVACLPLSIEDRLLGFVYLDDPLTRGRFDQAALAAVEAWLPLVSSCVVRALAQEQEAVLPGVISRSPVMQAVLSELARIARFDVSVLLTGETGTGKSLIARQLHAASPRAGGPFVHINCGAIPEALLESELFGHKKGTFTGASADRIGRFELAEGGTIFLDELDSCPLSCQIKLLVALQERQLTRLGDDRVIPINVRVIAAMNADPAQAIAAGRLREDLYYRLAVFVAHLPALRERTEDIPLLARHILDRTSQKYAIPPTRLSATALEELLASPWPGNVRELENTLDRAAVLAHDGLIQSIARRPPASTPPAAEVALPAGLIPALEHTAARLIGSIGDHAALRDRQTLDVFRGLLILEAVRRQQSREEGFRLVGLDGLLANRNHHRRLKKELALVADFYQKLGASPPDEPG